MKIKMGEILVYSGNIAYSCFLLFLVASMFFGPVLGQDTINEEIRALEDRIDQLIDENYYLSSSLGDCQSEMMGIQQMTSEEIEWIRLRFSADLGEVLEPILTDANKKETKFKQDNAALMTRLVELKKRVGELETELAVTEFNYLDCKRDFLISLEYIEEAREETRNTEDYFKERYSLEAARLAAIEGVGNVLDNISTNLSAEEIKRKNENLTRRVDFLIEENYKLKEELEKYKGGEK